MTSPGRQHQAFAAKTFDLGAVGAGLAFADSLPALTRALGSAAGRTAVVQAPPGTGKTTLVPPLLANLPVHGGGRIVVTQPRRVAARAAARRLSMLDGSPLGGRVGYSVRGERQAGPETVVEFVTPGILLRRLLSDPGLEGVAAVVLDEVHERGLETDLLVGMLTEVRELRGDLTVVAMSATLDAPRFAALLATTAAAGEDDVGGAGSPGGLPFGAPPPSNRLASRARTTAGQQGRDARIPGPRGVDGRGGARSRAQHGQLGRLPRFPPRRPGGFPGGRRSSEAAGHAC